MIPFHQLPAYKDKENIKAGAHEINVEIFVNDGHESRNMC